MALIGNASLLHKSPATYVTGTVGFCDRANWNKPGMMRNRGNLTLSSLWKYDAVPSGTYAGRAFLPPQKAGRLVTRSAFGIQAQAVGAMGLPGAAAASINFSASAIGGLFAGGVASCTMSVSGAASISGLAAGSASGVMSINATAITGAKAWGVASCTMSMPAAAVGYGRGYMRASTVDNSVLTPLSITQAVLGALASEYNVAGTVGNKINTASAGGVDLNALAQAIWEHATRTLTGGGAAPSALDIAAAVRTELAAELTRIDEAVSTRLASSAYTSPANADIAAIKAKTDTLVNADLSPLATSVQVAAVAVDDAAIAGAVRTELAAELTRLDVAVSTRLATSGYTAPTPAPSAETVAGAVLAAAQATPIHADAKKMNGATVIGTGAVGDPWRASGVSP